MIPDVPDHPTLLTVIAIALQAVIAVTVSYNGYISFRNNQLGKANGAKIDAVHKLANGTTDKLTDALALEQNKNAALQTQLVAPATAGEPSPTPKE